jgi:hypothetical protein
MAKLGVHDLPAKKVWQVKAQSLLTRQERCVTGQGLLCTRPIAGPEKWDEVERNA